MHLPYFVARRLSIYGQRSFSSFIIRIAFIAVSLSVCVMILGTSITRGYQQVITEKFYQCWGHIHVTNFVTDPGNLLNDDKMNYDSNLVNRLASIQGVQAVYPYRIQSALLKKNELLEGIVLKGLTIDQLAIQMKPFLKSGHLIQAAKENTTYSNQILISGSLSKLTQLNTGDEAMLFFVKPESIQPKIRKVVIAGVYATGLEDFDRAFLLCDSRLINSVNDDGPEVIQGYEINVKNTKTIAQLRDEIYQYHIQPPLQTYSIQDRFGGVFSWLDMMRMNEKIIVILMMVLAVINMITAILILILERTPMVGILKSMGMPPFQIQRVFIYASMYIVLGGIALGTALGLLLILIQKKWGFLKLDEATYYVKTVPMALAWDQILLINVVTALACFILLFIPSIIVFKISPVKAIRFD